MAADFPTTAPRYVKAVRAKGHRYFYFDNGDDTPEGSRYERLPDVSSPEFADAYATKLAARDRRERAPKDVDALIRQYQLDTRAYQRLSPASRTLYQHYLRQLAEAHGSRAPEAVSSADLQVIAAGLGKGGRSVFLKVVGILYTWAVKNELLERNPAEGIATRPRSSEWIYFIGAGADHPIKIGRAMSVEQRLAALQTACPYPLKVLAAYEAGNAVAEERRWHERFAEHAMLGEWFMPTPELLAAIADLTPHFSAVSRASVGKTDMFAFKELAIVRKTG